MNPFRRFWSWITATFNPPMEFPETVDDEAVPTEVAEVVPDLTADQWQVLQGLMIDAQKDFPAPGSGETKRNHVLRFFRQIWNGLEPVLVGLAIDAGVKYLKRIGRLA